MKIVAINGSPKGAHSNTQVMVNSFLAGARAAGAETRNVFLADYDIEHCQGCHSCWSKGPGQCITHDDMMQVLSLLGGANIILFATPVYFENISGRLKVFMDRLTMLGSPHSQASVKAESQDPKPAEVQAPKLMMVANCGYADRSEFDVISLWIKRVALKMRMELIGEIYATQGKLLTAPPQELQSAVANYLQALESAGKEVATDLSMSRKTAERLAQSFSAF